MESMVGSVGLVVGVSPVLRLAERGLGWQQKRWNWLTLVMGKVFGLTKTKTFNTEDTG
jgi:hypothetical protein